MFALGLLGWELTDGVFAEGPIIVVALASVYFAIRYFRATTKEQVETDWAKEAQKAKEEEREGRCCQPKPHTWSLL